MRSWGSGFDHIVAYLVAGVVLVALVGIGAYDVLSKKSAAPPAAAGTTSPLLAPTSAGPVSTVVGTVVPAPLRSGSSSTVAPNYCWPPEGAHVVSWKASGGPPFDRPLDLASARPQRSPPRGGSTNQHDKDDNSPNGHYRPDQRRPRDRPRCLHHVSCHPPEGVSLERP